MAGRMEMGWHQGTIDKNATMNYMVWSRGEELITENFLEYRVLKNSLPEGVV